jgi:hypothetical protein
MATPAEIQRQLAAARTAKRDAEVKKARDAASAKRETARLQAEDKRAIDRLVASEKARRQRVYGKAAEADFERWQASPAGLAALTTYREKNPTRGTVGNARDEERQRRDDLATIELFRKTYVASRIQNLATADENAFYASGPAPGTTAATPTKEEVVKGTAGTAVPGVTGTATPEKALLPIPKAVVANAVNTNTELTNADGTLKASTADSAFSLGKRTKGAFNIGRFRAEVSSADSVLPTHSFLVVFAPMPWAIQRYPQAANLDSILTMRCDNVVLPSINLLQEQNIRRYGFGPVENVAYGVNVGDFTLQFIVDKKAHVVGFFEAWLNRIVNRTSYGGADMNTATDGRTPYEIAYKDTYACSSVNVFMYDRSQNNVLEYNIYDVFPTGIQSMNMSWSEENTLMKLNVTFSFTDLRIQQSVEENKSGVGFGSSVDFQNALLTGPKATAAEIRALLQGGILVSDGKGGIGFDSTPGTVKVSGEYGFESGSVTSIQSSAASTTQTTDVPVQKNYSTLQVRINPGA